jgi:hypothetical protein
MVGYTSLGFIDLGQDEARVSCRCRVEIHRVRELRCLGHVVAQENFRCWLPIASFSTFALDIRAKDLAKLGIDAGAKA